MLAAGTETDQDHVLTTLVPLDDLMSDAADGARDIGVVQDGGARDEGQRSPPSPGVRPVREGKEESQGKTKARIGCPDIGRVRTW